MSTSYSLSSTIIDFSGGEDATDFMKHSATAALERRFLERGTVQAVGGAIVDGRLEIRGREFDVDPGWLFAVAAAWRFVDPEGAIPFVMGSLSYGMSGTTTNEIGVPDAPAADLTAMDARLGAVVGWSIAGTVNPYAVGRAFGLPAKWQLDGEDISGGDHYHYQVGAGLLLTLPGNFDLFVEGAPLGERLLTAGAGFAF